MERLLIFRKNLSRLLPRAISSFHQVICTDLEHHRPDVEEMIFRLFISHRDRAFFGTITGLIEDVKRVISERDPKIDLQSDQSVELRLSTIPSAIVKNTLRPFMDLDSLSSAASCCRDLCISLVDCNPIAVICQARLLLGLLTNEEFVKVITQFRFDQKSVHYFCGGLTDQQFSYFRCGAEFKKIQFLLFLFTFAAESRIHHCALELLDRWIVFTSELIVVVENSAPLSIPLAPPQIARAEVPRSPRPCFQYLSIGLLEAIVEFVAAKSRRVLLGTCTALYCVCNNQWSISSHTFQRMTRTALFSENPRVTYLRIRNYTDSTHLGLDVDSFLAMQELHSLRFSNVTSLALHSFTTSQIVRFLNLRHLFRCDQVDILELRGYPMNNTLNPKFASWEYCKILVDILETFPNIRRLQLRDLGVPTFVSQDFAIDRKTRNHISFFQK